MCVPVCVCVCACVRACVRACVIDIWNIIFAELCEKFGYGKFKHIISEEIGKSKGVNKSLDSGGG